MRALQFTEYGSPEVLSWGDAPEPHAGAGQIRIAVRAASVNPIDWKILTGALSGGQPLSDTGYLGYDAAGVVDDVGEGVTGVSVGDEVFGRGQNTQAEYAVLGSWAPKPSSVDWAVAAAGGVAGETAERGLRLLGVKATDTIFIDGGDEDSRPMEALAEVAELLAQNKLVIKVQTFPFARAAEAYRISQGGHVRGKLVLVP